MRRLPRIALALIAPFLVAGSCEFRASSNDGIRPPPEESPQPQDGLVVVVRVGDDGSASTAAAVNVGVVLATSVLSSGFALEADDTRPAAATLATERVVAARPVAVVSNDLSRRPTTAVPEPGAALLFAVGLGVTTLGMRRRARGSDLRGT